MKNLGKIILLMGLIILFTLGGVYSLKLFGINQGYPTRVVPFISMILGTIIFLKIIDHKSFADIGLHSFKSVLEFSGIFSLFALSPILIGVIINKGFMLSKSIDISLIGIIGYYFLVGFAEELLCRGYIYNVIEGDKLKIIIPALAFASYHFISPEFNIPIFIILFIYGIIFAYIYKMIRNLWPLIIFHMIWDMGTKYTGYYSNPLIDLLCLGAIVIIVKCIIEVKKKNKSRLTKIIV